MEYDILIILSVGFTLFCACGLIYECLKDLQQQNVSKRHKSKPRAAYSKIIKEVVRFSGPLLFDEGIKRYPHVKVSYRKCKGADGYYSPKHKTVEVLVNKNVDVNRIVFVTLHELAHYLQHQKDPEFRNYDDFEYDTNPFEIEADKFASDNQKSCIEYLESIGYI
jgi:Zn-dependent membrane protease YugP